MTRQFEAVVAAENVQDLMLRLEAAGEWMRIDPSVMPTVYHGAILSAGRTGPAAPHPRHRQAGPCEGHRAESDPSRAGQHRRWPRHAGRGLQRSRHPQRRGRAGVGWRPHHAAMAALLRHRFQRRADRHVEATVDDDAEKNALCTPIVPPTLATDWLRMLDVSMKNRQRWSRHPALQQWLAESRLNVSCFTAQGASGPTRPRRSR